MKERMLLPIRKNFLKIWLSMYIFLFLIEDLYFLNLTFYLNIITFYSYQKLMPKFVGEVCETQINPELIDGKCLHIFVTYDETTF
jgi:hypothetical protein